MKKIYPLLLAGCLIAVAATYWAMRMNQHDTTHDTREGQARRVFQGDNGESPGAPAVEPPPPATGQSGDQTARAGDTTTAVEQSNANGQDARASTGPETTAEIPVIVVENDQTPEQKRLQEVMDSNDETAMLQEAVKMTQSKDPRNRYAAISAFSWVGGADAALSLVLLAADEDPVVAEEAQEILDEVMEELEELDPEEAPIVWEEAIVQITTDGGREALFLSLSGQPQTTSIPILLNFLESDDPDLKEKAGEYLEFVTHGEKIANRAEGEAWLEKYVQEGSPIFSDDIKVSEQDN